MLILVTNDDGYLAKGLHSLVEVAKKFGEVYVVCPEKSASGLSHSITLNNPLRYKQIKFFNDVNFYICSGTPVDSVKLGLAKILPQKPNLILSGINHGNNSAISCFYSGTVCAAMEGSINGIHSIAFSLLDYSEDADFTASKYYAEIIIKNVLNNLNKLPTKICLNINIPKASLQEIKGIKVVRAAKGNWKEEFLERIDPANNFYYWMTGNFNNFEENATDTDEWALKNNYIAIVPLLIDLTAYEYIDKLNYFNI